MKENILEASGKAWTCFQNKGLSGCKVLLKIGLLSRQILAERHGKLFFFSFIEVLFPFSVEIGS